MSTGSGERRLSLNGRNAYISLTSEERADLNTKTKQRDDSLFLTAKTLPRPFSPQPTEYMSTKISESIKENIMQKKEMPKTILLNSSDIGEMVTPKVKSNETTGAIPKIISIACKADTKIQTGMDRYILVNKRKSSPRSSRQEPSLKMHKGIDPVSQNRYSLLSTDNDGQNQNETVKECKPPPIYLREPTSNVLVNKISQLVGKNNFYVASIRRGNVQETKVQTYTETTYRKIVELFDKEQKKYYTYQLKSTKGLVVIIKGIDSSVSPDEIKEELAEEGYEVKSVTNIINNNKIPQPMFKVELTFDSSRIKKKGATHPIYDLRYLCSRRIRVEEPFKRRDPPQCTNCQEFGHTKAYCKLPSVCVRCGDVHKSVECPHSKTDSHAKKCSNCGDNHTANYRGCPVYAHMRKATNSTRTSVKAKHQPSHMANANSSNETLPRIQINTMPFQFSYASTLKEGTSLPPNNPLENLLDKQKTISPMANNANSKTLPRVQPNTIPNTFSYARTLKEDAPLPTKFSLENSIEKLVETMNSFMLNMQSMMQEMMRNQSMLMQIVLKQK